MGIKADREGEEQKEEGLERVEGRRNCLLIPSKPPGSSSNSHVDGTNYGRSEWHNIPPEKPRGKVEKTGGIELSKMARGRLERENEGGRVEISSLAKEAHERAASLPSKTELAEVYATIERH